MRKELVFKIKNKNYYINKHLFQNDKKLININEVDTDKIVLSDKTPYDEHGANKYFIGYFNSGFKPLHVVIKNTESHPNNMNVLANNNELLKYIEMGNKIESLFNGVALNGIGFNSRVCNNKYIETKIPPYNDNKKLTKYRYCGHSILLLESICEAGNRYYPQTFSDKILSTTRLNN